MMHPNKMKNEIVEKIFYLKEEDNSSMQKHDLRCLGLQKRGTIISQNPPLTQQARGYYVDIF